MNWKLPTAEMVITIGPAVSTAISCLKLNSYSKRGISYVNKMADSPLISDDRQLLRPRRGYQNVGPDYSIAGCTPGVPIPVPAS